MRTHNGLNRVAADFVRLAEQMGPPPPLPDRPLLCDDLTVARCACNKLVPASSLKVFNTGVVYALDNVCEGCKKTFAGLAQIVCARCKVVVARLAPHKDPVGFRFDAGKTYHTESCPKCDTSVINGRTVIIEQLIYHRAAGKKL